MTHDLRVAPGVGYGCSRWPMSWAESGRSAGSCGATVDVLPLAQTCVALGAGFPADAEGLAWQFAASGCDSTQRLADWAAA